MIKTFLFILLSISLTLFGQTTNEVKIPKFDDAYCNTIKTLEEGQVNINYKEFRESFLDSKQFLIAFKKSKEFHELMGKMYQNMDESNYPELIKITKQMLSIDYTSMIAHKILRQTYEFIEDKSNAQKYKDIQYGLLKSIVRNGDGKSCPTAWSVIQASEEHFILKMVGAKLERQSIDHQGGLCDKIEVIVDGKKKTYYFDTSLIFKSYQKLGIK